MSKHSLQHNRRKAFRQGRVGKASREFDGVNSFIEIADDAAFTFSSGGVDQPFSAAAWIKMNDYDGFRVISKWASQGDEEWTLLFRGVDNAGYLALWLKDEAGGGQYARHYGTRLNLGQWYHVCGTYDGTGSPDPRPGIKLYVDGVRVDDTDVLQSTGYTTMNDTTRPVTIGQIGNASTDVSDGFISDARIYDIELTQADVTSLANGKHVKPSNLLGWWLTDTDDLIDHSGNGYDGIEGATPTFINDNGPLPANNEFGKSSWQFDGNDDRGVVIPNDFTNTFQSSFTIAHWLKLDEAHHPTELAQVFFGHQTNTPINRVIAWMSQDGSMSFSYFANNFQGRAKTTFTFPAGPTPWVHLAYTVEPSGITFYKDGVAQTLDATWNGDMSTVTMSQYNVSGLNFHLGNRDFSDPSTIDGNLSDFRIYKAAIPASEIANLYNGIDYQTNLVGHWLKNENILVDYAQTPLFLADGPIPGNEWFGDSSRVFDGPGDFIDVPNSASSFNTIHTSRIFTISFWAKWDNYNVAESVNAIMGNNYNTSTNGCLVQFDYRAAQSTTNALVLFLTHGVNGQSDHLKFNNVVQDNGWHHWSLRGDGSNVYLYRDGSFIAQQSLVYSGTGNAGANLNIGRGNDGALTPVNYFIGSLADVRIYDADIGATEITNLYNGINYTTNLKGHWFLNTNDIVDYSQTTPKFSSDGPLPGNPTFGDKSRFFDGTNDVIKIEDNGELSFGNGQTDRPFSVCAWVKMVDATKFRMLSKYLSSVEDEQEILFTTTAGDKLVLLLRDALTTGTIRQDSTATIAQYENTWVHFAATYDGSSTAAGIKLYLNGAILPSSDSVSSGSYTAMPNSLTEPFYIGLFDHPTPSSRSYANGSMADIRIYNIELSLAQIADIHSGTNVTTGLVGHWLTNTDDLIDHSGSGNTGIIYNGLNTGSFVGNDSEERATKFSLDGPLV